MSEKDSAMNEQIEKLFEKEATKLREEIISELYPFINGIYRMGTESRNYALFKEAYIYFKEKYEEKRGLFKSILTTEASPTAGKSALSLLFLYLGAVESIGNSVVDILVLLLVANGRDFHIECRGYRTPRIRHVLSIEKDLEKERVPLGTKLSFLRENGIETVTSIIDSELRNNIAHLKFDVKEDRIYVRGEMAEAVTLVGLRKLFVVTSTVERILKKTAEDRGFLTEGSDKL